MGTTAKGIPYPENTDPLANIADAVEAVAQSVDAKLPASAMRRGIVTASTDASSDLTITHGLGSTPTAVVVTVGNSTFAYHAAAHTLGATTFKVRMRNSSGALVASSGGFIIHWLALA